MHHLKQEICKAQNLAACIRKSTFRMCFADITQNKTLKFNEYNELHCTLS